MKAIERMIGIRRLYNWVTPSSTNIIYFSLNAHQQRMHFTSVCKAQKDIDTITGVLEEAEKQRACSYREQAEVQMPFLRVANTEYYQSFWKEIEQGMSVYRAYATVFDNKPWATKPFLRKMGNCTLKEVERTGYILGEAFSGKNGVFDQGGFNKFMGAVPSSFTAQQDSKIFIESLNLAYRFSDGNRRALHGMLMHSTGKWKKNICSENLIPYNEELINRYLEAVARDILFPEYIKIFSDRISAKESEYIVSDVLIPIAREVVCCSVSPMQLMKLGDGFSRSWHAIEEEKIKHVSLSDDREWYPLIKEKKVIIDGYTFSPIVNRKGLLAEGERMEHCVGGYARLCQSGESHVFSMSSSSGAFTLELNAFNSRVILSQLQGAKIKSLLDVDILKMQHEAVDIAVAIFIDRLNNRKITPHDSVGSVIPIEKQDASHYVGFDIGDRDVRQRVFQTYVDMKVLPKKWKTGSIEKCMGQIGVRQMIRESKPSDSFVGKVLEKEGVDGRSK